MNPFPDDHEHDDDFGIATIGLLVIAVVWLFWHIHIS